MITIDYREDAIIKIFTENGLEFKTENLIHGDFIISEGDCTFYVIERKSVQDLCAN